jgi:hypothetical protein
MAMIAARAAINARMAEEANQRKQAEAKKKNEGLAGHLDEATRNQLISDLKETQGMKYIALMALGKKKFTKRGGDSRALVGAARELFKLIELYPRRPPFSPRSHRYLFAPYPPPVAASGPCKHRAVRARVDCAPSSREI